MVDHIVERLEDVDLYYIESTTSRSPDELYYLHDGNFYFHGDKVWSGYHPFIKYFNHIPVTNTVDKETWFVGSRPNYTHQLIDFSTKLTLFDAERKRVKP